MNKEDELEAISPVILASIIQAMGNMLAGEHRDDIVEDIPIIGEALLEFARKGMSGDDIQAAIARRAVTIEESLESEDHIISMIDGKPYKVLKRHLRAHDLTPDQYRRRFALPSDYPMVATNYSQKRSGMARKAGLGRAGE
ncbi:MAG: transcriptional regulator [Acidobacteria bacterium]|nr:transcriptional regulator [Acidobacteriota bacterium]